MKWVCLLFIASPAIVSAATQTETRQIVDSAGNKFKCTYKLSYTNKAVSKAKSSVNCLPNKSGKTVTETFVIEKLGKSVAVKHTIKKGADSISAITMKDFAAQTTLPPSPGGPAQDMTCKCKMNPDSQTGLTTSVRSFLPAILNRQLLGSGLFSNLGSLSGAAAASPASNTLDLASLLGGGSDSNDLVTQLAMQVAQQQLNDFINNGGAEEAMTNLVESGQLEEIVTNFVESGQLESMLSKTMENVDMESMMNNVVADLETQMAENMQNGGFEEMISEGPLGEMMNVTGGLEELMGNGDGLMGSELFNQLGNMELNMKCSCNPVE